MSHSTKRHHDEYAHGPAREGVEPIGGDMKVSTFPGRAGHQYGHFLSGTSAEGKNGWIAIDQPVPVRR